MKESSIMKQIQIILSAHGFRLFRNNVGVLRDGRGEYVAYGLCEGSSDLIGWRTIEITPEMVGTKIAQFVASEVKRPGKKATPKQTNFINAVCASGGIGFVASSVDEALDAIQR